MTPDKNQIAALLFMVEDPDEEIFSQIKKQILSLGIDVVPEIEKAWEKNQFGENYHIRLENIIHEIQFKDVYNSLKKWKENGAKNLLDGVILVNKYQYPDLDRKKIENQINTITQDAQIEISEHMTGLEKIAILNHLFYKVHGFIGNKEDYYAISNSFLTHALDSKKGNALILAIIYLEIATRLNIPLVGVNLPNHFILGYNDFNKVGKEFGSNNDILFYINVFSNGAILSEKEIDDFLKKIKIQKKSEYYNACNNQDIVKRLLTNLKYSQSRLNANEKVTEIDELLLIFNKK